MSATHPAYLRSLKEKQALKDKKPLRSLEDWGEELNSQSKDIDLIVFKNGIGYKNGIAVISETKKEITLQEHKPCIEKKDMKKVKWEEGIAEPKPRKSKTHKPKVLQVAVPLEAELAVPITTQQANTTIDYMNLEHMGKTKVVIAKTLQYDYFNIPIEWDAKDINITDRNLYYKNMLVDCKAPNQPADRHTPIEIWVDFKINDYSFYFQKPTM